MSDWFAQDMPQNRWSAETSFPYSPLSAHSVIELTKDYDVGVIRRRFFRDRGYIIVDGVRHT